ncbi:MAG: aminoglycoside phosphotransferase family protein [Fibrobacterota bacterium]
MIKTGFSFLGEYFEGEKIQGGASDRQFVLFSYKGKQALAVFFKGDALTGFRPYLEVTSALISSGISVPAVMDYDPDKKIIAVEYVEGRPLSLVFEAGEARINHFRLAGELLGRLHLTDIKLPCSFDREKYDFEYNFHFVKKLLAYLCPAGTPAGISGFRDFYFEITDYLCRRPFVFTHRDYQSSNLICAGDGMTVIDYQDARNGPAEYDIASFLYDSYIDPGEENKKAFISSYFEVSGADPGPDFDKTLDYCAIQRKIHDAGAFIYASERLPGSGYLRYVEKAVADFCAVAGKYHTNPLLRWLPGAARKK